MRWVKIATKEEKSIRDRDYDTFANSEEMEALDILRETNSVTNYPDSLITGDNEICLYLLDEVSVYMTTPSGGAPYLCSTAIIRRLSMSYTTIIDNPIQTTLSLTAVTGNYHRYCVSVYLYVYVCTNWSRVRDRTGDVWLLNAYFRVFSISQIFTYDHFPFMNPCRGMKSSSRVSIELVRPRRSCNLRSRAWHFLLFYR